MPRPPRKDGRNARTVANNKYNLKAYDRISLCIPKGEKERIKNEIGSQSLNGFIWESIQEMLERKSSL